MRFCADGGETRKVLPFLILARALACVKLDFALDAFECAVFEQFWWYGDIVIHGI